MIPFIAVFLHGEFTMSTGAVMAEGLGIPDWHSWFFAKEPWAGADDVQKCMDSSRKPTSGTI